MARVTVADLLDRLEALEAEVEALREQVEAEKEEEQSAPVQVNLHREVAPPRPLSQPINFQAMNEYAAFYLSYYDEWSDIFNEERVWGANTYL